MNISLSGICRYRVTLLLLSLTMTPSLNALEYDITGIGLRENRFSRGGDSHLGGIPLDYNGVVSAFPGLSGKISLYEKKTGWGETNLFWRLGGMLHTWNLIDLYFGPVFRLSFYLSKRWSVDCDVSLVWNIWYNYHTIRLRFLLTPFIALFPSLRYRGNEYTAGFNLAYVPECIGFPFTDNDMAYFFTSFKLNSEKDKDELMRGGSQFSVATIAFGEVDHNRLKDLLASSNVSRLNLKGSQSRLDSALESSEVLLESYEDVESFNFARKQGYSPDLVIMPDTEELSSVSLHNPASTSNRVIPVLVLRKQKKKRLTALSIEGS